MISNTIRFSDIYFPGIIMAATRGNKEKGNSTPTEEGKSKAESPRAAKLQKTNESSKPSGSDSNPSSSSSGSTVINGTEVKPYGPYYSALGHIDGLHIFTGVNAKAQLAKFVEANHGAVVKQHETFDALLIEQNKSRLNMNSVAQGNLLDLQSNPQANAFVTPEKEVIIKTEPGTTRAPSSLFNMTHGATAGEAIDLSSSTTVLKISKPDISALINSPSTLASSSGGTMKIKILSTAFVPINADEWKGVVFIQFTTRQGPTDKRYWAMKDDVMFSILTGLNSSGQFSGKSKLVDGAFEDIQSAQLRASPHGPNMGQCSMSRGNKYSVDVSFIVLRLQKSAIPTLDDEIIRIGSAIKSVVSSDWFEETYMEYASANLSQAYIDALKKPKERFFSLLNKSELNVMKNVTLDCFLLDDVIHNLCSSFTNENNASNWPEAVKKMAYKSGVIPKSIASTVTVTDAKSN